MSSVPFPSEKFVEDYIFDFIRREKECPLSGMNVTSSVRQYEIKGYGITDIIKIEVSPYSVDVTILELKNETLKESHLGQLARYMRGADRVANRYRRFLPNDWDINIRGELAGPFDSSSNNLVYLSELLQEKISIYELSLSMQDGFRSSDIGSGWFNHGENLAAHKQIVKKVFWEVAELNYGLSKHCNVIPMENSNGEG